MVGKHFPRIILIAHSSGSEASDHVWKTRLLENIKVLLPEHDIDMAFIKGNPDIVSALDPDDREILVLPLCLSDGFFHRKLIPEVLAEIPEKIGIRLLPPLYEDREGMFEIMKEASFEACPPALRPLTRLLAVSHGSEAQGETGETDYAPSLCRNIPGFKDYEHVFLKKSPSLLEWTERQQEGDTLVLPCFLMEGKHTTNDIPAILGLPSGQSAFGAHPFKQGTIRYAAPIGVNPGIASLIARSVRGL